jgi:lipopolysaccharide/colanic/teichoic acid biosynthesis glycosyltransferase
VSLGRPVIFKQDRPGRIDKITGKEKIFRLYKFRTMKELRDTRGEYLSDEMRLTRFGKFLRSSSLDELPEIVNILKGDMSIIGPRPLLVKYLPIYNVYQRRRHEVRPGLSGNAQVNGRNSISWETKFELDIEYVDNITFLGDLKLIIKTVGTVINREGINSSNCSTMEEFTGA